MQTVGNYPASDYDPRMVNTHRLRDVQAASIQKLNHMLTTVLQRAQADNKGSGTGRYQGYNPEEVYRVINSFTVLEKGEELAKVLDAHFAQFAAETKQRLLALQPPTIGTAATTSATADSAQTQSSDWGADVGAEETEKKRRRLSKGPPEESTQNSSQEALAAASAHECFLTLVSLWRQLVSACDEIQTVWASFANQYTYGAGSKGSDPRHDNSSCAVVLPSGMGGISHRSTMLKAAMVTVAPAITSADAVLTRAIDGYVAAVLEDAAVSHPVPTGRKGNEEGTSAAADPAATTSAALEERQQRRVDIKCFTECCHAIAAYVPRAQPRVVQAVREYYAKAAVDMYADEVPCLAYISFAQEALAEEKARAQQYLHPHTAPLLVEAVERSLLGDVAVEVVSRDFAALFDESANASEDEAERSHRRRAVATSTATAVAGDDAVEGQEQPSRQDTLALVWKVLSRCTHVPREPVVQCFKSHVEELGTVAVDGIVAAVRGAALPPQLSSTKTPSSPPQQVAQDATKDAVLALFTFVHRAKTVIARCFAPDQKVFATQLDERLQRVLEPNQKIVVEVLAAFVDNVFKRLETGELPLTYGSKHKGGAERSAVVERAAGSQDADEEADAHEKGNEEADSGNAALLSAAPEDAKNAHPSANDERPQEDEEGGRGPLEVSSTEGQRRGRSGEELLGLIAYVCTHFPSMDTFEQLYWRDMGRRLLHPNRNVNLEAERCFLRIFEGICGNSFISKFEGMIRDTATWEALSEQYKSWTEARGTIALAPPANASSPPQGSTTGLIPVEELKFDAIPQGLDIRLQFITDGLWPQCSPLPVRLPGFMQNVITVVEQFYHRLYAQRVIKWQHQLSHGVLKAKLRPGAPSRQLSGTLVQCLALLVLDSSLKSDEDVMTVKDLCEGLGVSLEVPEVTGALLGLCHERFALLVRQRSSSSSTATPISPQDTLRFNAGFAFTSAKMRIPFQVRVEKPAGAGSPPDGASATAEEAVGGEVGKANEDRLLQKEGHMIQIAIVQYMKAHGKAKHEELVQHMQQTKFNFTVTMPMIKKTLDRLIDRGFVERKGQDVYQYVA